MYPYYNYLGFMFGYPRIPQNISMPPTINDILNSIVNGTKENILDWTGASNLAKEGHRYIFDFDYPLSSSVDKDEFEIMILNHFILRRIGTETVTLFKMYLSNKLNEIMPYYNKMFDSFNKWKIFEDGEEINRTLNSNYIQEETRKDNKTTNIQTNSSTNATNTANTEDKQRYSDTPQNELGNIESGNYMTDYRFNTAKDTSNSEGSSNGTQDNTENSSGTTNEKNDYQLTENTKHSISDKIKLLAEYQNTIKTIYSMIYKDLEPLFYQIIM